MSTNPLYLQLVKLFTTDTDLEVLVAECMSRMSDFSTLCEEQNRIDAGVIDSELELTTPQAKRLNGIHDAIIQYPSVLNPAYPEALDATVGMLINDRELPAHVIASLREVVEGLVKKNGLILTAEPTVAAHVYDINPSESYPVYQQDHGPRGHALSQADAALFAKPLTGDAAVYDWEALRKEVESTGISHQPMIAHAPRDSHHTLQEGMRSLIPVRAEDGGVPNVVTDNIVYPLLKKLPTPMSGAHLPDAVVLNGDASAIHASLTAQARATSGYGNGLNAHAATEVTANVAEDGVFLSKEFWKVQELDPFLHGGHGDRAAMFRRQIPVNFHGDADYKKLPELEAGSGEHSPFSVNNSANHVSNGEHVPQSQAAIDAATGFSSTTDNND